MITATHEQIREILKTLPIGYYLGERTPVLYEESGDSYCNLMDRTIHVSGETVMHGLAHLPADLDPYEMENAIRAILYHELSHVIMTPKMKVYKWLNCFEDERIETLLSKYYLGVNFKKMCMAVNGWTKDWMPEDADSYWYGICRFRQGPEKFVKKVAELIRKWKTLRAGASEYRAEDYRNDVKRFYDQVCEDWYQNHQQRQQEQEQRNEQRNQEQQKRDQQKQEQQKGQQGNQGQQGQQGGSNGQSGEQNKDQQGQGGGQSGKDGKQNDKGGKNANGGKGGKDKQNESSDDKDKNAGGSGKDEDEKKDGKDSGNGSEAGSDGNEQDGQNNGGGNSNGGQDGEDGEDSSNGGNSDEGDEGDQDGNQNDSDGDSDGQEENEGDQSEGNNGGEGTDGDEDADADDQNGQSGHGKSSKNRGKDAKEQKRGKGDQGNQINQVNESTDKDSDKEEEGNGGSAGDAAEEDEDVAEEEINGRVGADNEEEINEITRESIARDFQKMLNKFHEEQVGRVLERLIIQHNKKRASRTPMSIGYTGKVDYKKVATQHDYRWFARKGGAGENKFGSTHLTLWVDCSGSFCEDIHRINSVIHELNRLARRLGRDFSFDVVQMTMKNEVVPTTVQLEAMGCNGFGPGVEECIRKTRKAGCNNYNVVVWDGDMFSGFGYSSQNRYLPVLNKAFNNQNTVIVSDGENKGYLDRQCPKARTRIIHGRYAEQFVEALLQLLSQVLV